MKTTLPPSVSQNPSGLSPQFISRKIPLYFGLMTLTLPVMVHSGEFVAPASTEVAATQHSFNIPSQPLYSALNALAEQAKAQFIFTEEMVKGLSSPGVSGQLSTQEALKKVLEGNGLTYSFTKHGVITLKIIDTAKDPTLPTVKVTGKTDSNQLSSLTTPSTQESKLKLNRIPGGVSLIEEDRIREGVVSTVNDALAYAPGVFVGDVGAGAAANGTQISMRGSDINSRLSPLRGLKLLRNGMPFTFANGESDTQLINLDSIHNIEVYRGANAMQYGSSNLGGAINFITPTGYTADKFKVGMTMGTNGYIKPSVSAAGVFGNGWDAYGSFSYLDFGGNREKTSQEIFAGYGNLGYRWNEKNETRLHIDIQNQNHLFASPLTQKQLEKNPRQNPSTNAPPTGFPFYRIDLQHTVRMAGGDQFDVGAYYSDQDWSWFISDFGLFRDRWQDTGFTWRHLINNQLWGLKNQIVWGGLNQLMWIDDRNMWNDDFSAPSSANNIPLQGHEKDHYNNLEAYLEDQLSLTDKFTMILGGQIQYRKASINQIFSTNPSTPNQGVQDFFNFNPKLGFTWQASPETQLFGNVSRSAEPPPIIDLINIYQQPKLRNQKGTTIEVGTRGQSNWLKWDLAVYHAWLDHELLIVPQPPNFNTFITSNANDTQHTGVELGLEKSFPLSWLANGDDIRFRGNYTWNNFHFNNDPGLGDKRLPGIPEHNGRIEALYEHPSGFYIGPNLQTASANYVDFSNTLSAKPYALMGARVGWNDGKHWKLFVDARNLTNEHYAASVYVTGNANGQDPAQFNPGATRMIYGGVEYRF